MKVSELLGKAGVVAECAGAPKFYRFAVSPVWEQDRDEPQIKIISTSRDFVLGLQRVPLDAQYAILHAIVEKSLEAKEGFIAIEWGNRTHLASLTRMDAPHLIILHIS